MIDSLSRNCGKSWHLYDQKIEKSLIRYSKENVLHPVIVTDGLFSIVHNRIFIIFENSSESFRYSMDTHLVKNNSNALLHSFIWNCSNKRLCFESMEWILTTFLPKRTPLPRPHVSTIFYQTRSRTSARINSTSSFTSRFSFESAHIESRSLIYRSYILNLFSPSGGLLLHRKPILFNNEFTH